ncbi:hypothetical protein LTR66_012775 [Elasticomyces elasticus]|nr:hypothetical protein LTR66_012775 [Elasticomyces elasticus]
MVLGNTYLVEMIIRSLFWEAGNADYACYDVDRTNCKKSTQHIIIAFSQVSRSIRAAVLQTPVYKWRLFLAREPVASCWITFREPFSYEDPDNEPFINPMLDVALNHSSEHRIVPPMRSCYRSRHGSTYRINYFQTVVSRDEFIAWNPTSPSNPWLAMFVTQPPFHKASIYSVQDSYGWDLYNEREPGGDGRRALAEVNSPEGVTLKQLLDEVTKIFNTNDRILQVKFEQSDAFGDFSIEEMTSSDEDEYFSDEDEHFLHEDGYFSDEDEDLSDEDEANPEVH